MLLVQMLCHVSHILQIIVQCVLPNTWILVILLLL